MSQSRLDPNRNADGSNHVLGGVIDPRVAPGILAPKDSLYLLRQGAGSPGLLLMKQDDGLSVNWSVVLTGISPQDWIASVLLDASSPPGGGSPIPMYTTQDGDFITKGKVIIVTAFNGNNPTISIGTNGNNDLVQPSAKNNPQMAKGTQFEEAAGLEVSATGDITPGTKIQTYFALDGANTGKAIMLVERTRISGEV